MASNIPERAESLRCADGGDDPLGSALEGLLEFTGAGAGWIGFRTAAGNLVFPAHRGPVPEAWLTLQQGRGNVWGFEIREGPTLINDLRPLPALGSPPLRNLLSSPLGPPGQAELPPRGHIVLANKPNGFTSHDASLLQGVAHLLYRQMVQQEERPGSPPCLGGSLLARILDRVDEGVLVVDAGGKLLYANATWLRWNGFPADELIGTQAPFPFWIGHQQLTSVSQLTETSFTSGMLPFRRRDHSLFWCQVQTAQEEDPSGPVIVALLRPAEAPGPATVPVRPATPAATEEPVAALPSLPCLSWLLLRLEPNREVSGWGPRWERLTGLSAADVQGTLTEVVLDWLFPQQQDREQVADWMHHPERTGGQAVLGVLSEGGQRRMLCTLLPLPPMAGVTEMVAPSWLLLVGEADQTSMAGAGGSDTLRTHAPTKGPGPHVRPTRQSSEQEPPA